MKPKISVWKHPEKNMYGDWIGSISVGRDTEISIITTTRKERNLLLTKIKELIKNEDYYIQAK